MKIKQILVSLFVAIGLLATAPAFVVAAPWQSVDLDFHGYAKTLGIVRDNDGLQYGFFDKNEWVQWRTSLKFDVAVKPVYDNTPTFGVTKLFLSYSGAYDAIFDIESKYNGIPGGRGVSRYDLGLDAVRTENDLREVFVDAQLKTDSGWLTNFRVGRQIVQWGEAGVFNVVNVINPQDISSKRNFDTPEDLANPIWMARIDIASPPMGPFTETNLQILYIPDNRPTLLGPAGAPYGAGVLQNDQSSGLTNPEIGLRAGAAWGDYKVNAYYWNGFVQSPTVVNLGGLLTGGPLYFDHPKYKMYGLSFNKGNVMGSWTLRGEANYKNDEYIADYTGGLNPGYAGFKSTEVLVGLDGSYFKGVGFPGAGGSPLSVSYEAYWKHVNDYEFDGALRNGAKENAYGVTFVAYTFFWNGKSNPTVVACYDFGGVLLTALVMDYTWDGRWYVKGTLSSTWGKKDLTYSPISPLVNSSELGLTFGYRW